MCETVGTLESVKLWLLRDFGKDRAVKRNLLIGATFAVAMIGLGVTERALEQTAAAQARNDVQVPIFEVDPFWPKTMPNNWVFGHDDRPRHRREGSGLDHPSRQRSRQPGPDRIRFPAPAAGPGWRRRCRAAAAEPASGPSDDGSASAAIRRRRLSRSIRPATSCTAGAARAASRLAGVEPRHRRGSQGHRVDRRATAGPTRTS